MKEIWLLSYNVGFFTSLAVTKIYSERIMWNQEKKNILCVTKGLNEEFGEIHHLESAIVNFVNMTIIRNRRPEKPVGGHFVLILLSFLKIPFAILDPPYWICKFRFKSAIRDSTNTHK